MVTKLSTLKNAWKTIIGLEVHVQLNSKTKLFSVGPNKFHSPPNSNVAFFDMAIPGTLPIINSKCVELAILAASVLKCEINLNSEFDRKHYFYGDLPAGYQITQYRKPIATNGSLTFLWNSSSETNLHKDVRQSNARIIEIHLEQDSGKSLHDHDRNVSLIDLNRAGVGLIEVVTDCDFETSLEAVGFVRELRDLFFECGICTGHMEEGELRVDANISVKLEHSKELGQRTEIKNINSLRGVQNAIEFESNRQIQLLESGKSVLNETRLYDPVSESTVSMRDKEDIQDYRYFPEPNLAPLRLHNICQHRDNQCLNPHNCIPCIQSKLKNFTYPSEKNRLLVNRFFLSFNQCNTILTEPGLYAYLMSTCEFVPSNLLRGSQKSWLKLMGSYALTILLGGLRTRGLSVDSCLVSHQNFAHLVTMTINSQINSIIAAQIFSKMLDDPERSPQSIVEEDKCEQINDPKIIEKIVREFIKNNMKALQDYNAGNKRVSRFFKKTIKSENKDLINPHILNSIIDQILEEKI